MNANHTQISATEFKKHFLQLVNQVKTKHDSFIVTKRKVPVAKVVPLDQDILESKKEFYGFMQGTTSIKDDIINYSSENDWEVINERSK